jgi:hypothetical protein
MDITRDRIRRLVAALRQIQTLEKLHPWVHLLLETPLVEVKSAISEISELVEELSTFAEDHRQQLPQPTRSTRDLISWYESVMTLRIHTRILHATSFLKALEARALPKTLSDCIQKDLNQLEAASLKNDEEIEEEWLEELILPYECLVQLIGYLFTDPRYDEASGICVSRWKVSGFMVMQETAKSMMNTREYLDFAGASIPQKAESPHDAVSDTPPVAPPEEEISVHLQEPEKNEKPIDKDSNAKEPAVDKTRSTPNVPGSDFTAEPKVEIEPEEDTEDVDPMAALTQQQADQKRKREGHESSEKHSNEKTLTEAPVAGNDVEATSKEAEKSTKDSLKKQKASEPPRLLDVADTIRLIQSEWESRGSGDLAGWILNSKTPVEQMTPEEVGILGHHILLKLIEENKPTLAFELGRILEQRTESPLIPATLARALSMLLAPFGEAIEHSDLWMDAYQIETAPHAVWQIEAMRQIAVLTVLPFNAELRVDIPELLLKRIPSLQKMMLDILAAKDRQALFRRNILHLLRTDLTTKIRFERFKENVDKEYFRLRNTGYNYAYASSLMTYLLKPDELLGRIQTLLDAESLKKDQIAELKQLQEQFVERSGVEDLVMSGIQSMNGTRGDRIVGSPMDKIITNFGKIANLIEERLSFEELIHKESPQRQSSMVDNAKYLFSVYRGSIEGVRKELTAAQNTASKSGDLIDWFLYRYAGMVFDSVDTVLGIETLQEAEIQEFEVSLPARFLGEPDLLIDEEGGLQFAPDTDEFRTLVSALSFTSRPLVEMFDNNCRSGNFLNASRILDAMRQDGQTPTAEKISARMTKEYPVVLDRIKAKDQAAMEKTSYFVGDPMMAQERDSINEELVQIIDDIGFRQASVHSWNFVEKRIDFIQRRIDSMFSGIVTQLEARLESKPNMTSETSAQIKTLIADRRFDLAEALLDNPDEPYDFNRKNRFIEDYFKDNVYNFIFQSINEKPSMHFLSTWKKKVDPAADSENGTRVTELEEIWNNVKHKPAETAHLRDLLRAIGFSGLDKGVEGKQKAHPVKTSTIFAYTLMKNRYDCPSAAFGSTIGKIEVIVITGSVTDEALARVVNTSTTNNPTLILVFSALKQATRRKIAHSSRINAPPALVVDEVLLAALVARDERWFRDMFFLGLPFVHLQPYASGTAGIVPPEMFYGRSAAKQQLKSMPGSCVIYGGRQLGKTALLKSVESEVHCPEEGRIAKWIDLRAQGIGDERPADELVKVLSKYLLSVGISPRATSDFEELRVSILDWLSISGDRRILLLLDEADRFMAHEKSEKVNGHFFHLTTQIISLITNTNGRFKVVFAGLHNVQRATKIPNNPLVHLGQPIAIAPFVENGDLREAKNLVRDPMEMMGYRFESESIIQTILLWTNYYPSLIQLFCGELLQHLKHSGGYAEDSTPPYTIGFKDIDAVHRSQELERSIADRFIWTIELDPCYKAITYCIALGYLEKSGKPVMEPDSGFETGWIYNQVQTYYPQGFPKSMDSVEFQTLLDELCELGVLKRTENGKYRIKTRNVLRMLAKPEKDKDIAADFAEKLLKLEEQKPVPTVPSSEIRQIGDSPSERSALTNGQINEILESGYPLHIVFGSKATGIEKVEQELQEAWGNRRFHRWKTNNQSSLTKTIKEQLEVSDPDQQGFLEVIPFDVGWNHGWLEALKTIIDKNKLCRIVFIADPLKASRIVQEYCAECLSSYHCISLKPWHRLTMDHWLDDGVYGKSSEERTQIKDAVGGWPYLIDSFVAQNRQAPYQAVKSLADFHSRLIKPLQAFGIGSENFAEAILRTLQQWGKLSVKEIAKESGNLDVGEVKVILEWAERLMLVEKIRENDKEGWVIDSAVEKVLAASAP